jgi:undecaprenyl-diphosphatase
MTGLISFDRLIFQFVHQFAGRSVVLDDLGVFFAQYAAYLMVVGFLVLAYYELGWRKKLYVFVEGVIAVILARGLLTEIIRFFYHHERPFSFYGFSPLIAESGWSFPSGHATWFFALATVVWYVNRKWGIAYFVLATLMGIARIYTGVHWPFDIIAGAMLGVLSGIFVRWLLKKSREALYSARPLGGLGSRVSSST